tara:strand:- start:63 stop:335 length:273 start_codon:yes stop_codon:yes gene_type:complete
MYKNKRSKREQSILPGAGVGVKVLYVKGKDGREKGLIDLALKKFKKEVKESGKLFELKERSHFVPKSEKKRIQKENAIFFQQLESKEENY